MRTPRAQRPRGRPKSRGDSDRTALISRAATVRDGAGPNTAAAFFVYPTAIALLEREPERAANESAGSKMAALEGSSTQGAIDESTKRPSVVTAEASSGRSL